MTTELLAFLMPPRHPRPANSMSGASSAVYHNYPYIIATRIIRQSALLAS